MSTSIDFNSLIQLSVGYGVPLSDLAEAFRWAKKKGSASLGRVTVSRLPQDFEISFGGFGVYEMSIEDGDTFASIG